MLKENGRLYFVLNLFQAFEKVLACFQKGFIVFITCAIHELMRCNKKKVYIYYLPVMFGLLEFISVSGHSVTL